MTTSFGKLKLRFLAMLHIFNCGEVGKNVA